MKSLRSFLFLLGVALALTANAAVQLLQPTWAQSEEPEKVGDYYILTTQQHLQWVAEKVNSVVYYKNPVYLRLRLGANIQSEHLYYTFPIGGASINVDGAQKISAFWGELDGAGHYISYVLDEKQVNADYRALFGYIGFPGKDRSRIHDVVLLQPYFEGHSYVGGLAGMALLTDFCNVTVHAPFLKGSGSYIGGIVGYADNCTITRCANTTSFGASPDGCYVRGTATSFTSDPGYVGGIVGNANNTSITACFNSMEVSIVSHGFCVGGIAGAHYAGSPSQTIKDCGNTGPVSGCEFVGTGTANTGAKTSLGTQSGICTGGIVGRTYGAQNYTISGCYQSGIVSGHSRVGKLYGAHGTLSGANNSNTLVISNCIINQDKPSYFCYGSQVETQIPDFYNLSQNNNNYINLYKVHDDDFNSGRVGLFLNKLAGTDLWGQTLCHSDEYGHVPLMPQQITTLAALNGKTDGIAPHYCAPGETHCAYCDCALPLSRPKLNSDGAYAITSVPEFHWFAAMVNASMPDQNDISGGRVTINHPLNAVLEADLDFDPAQPIDYIGRSRTYYNSTFDGKGHTLSHFTISSGNICGLFGDVYNSTIRNIKASHANVTGKIGVGIIAGRAYNTDITGCFADQHSTLTGGSAVGGIVGKAYNRDGSNHVILRCTNAASIRCNDTGISANGTDFGGIVGEATGYDIERCFNNGEVYFTNKKDATYPARMGGIVGTALSSNISFCGNTANISANPECYGDFRSIAGIVGYAATDDPEIQSSISDSYNTAAVLGGWPAETANILAESNGCTIQRCATTPARNLFDEVIPFNYPSHMSGDVHTLTNSTLHELYDYLYAHNSNPSWGQPVWAQLACKHSAPYVKGCYDREGDIVDVDGYHEHAELVAGVCPVCKKQVEGGGENPGPGTDPDPEEQHPGVQPAVDNSGYYLIASVDNLIWLRYAVNHNDDVNRPFNCRLTRDLDLKAYPTWESIGLEDHPFSSEFDGQNHKITGLRGEVGNTSFTGLFRYISHAHIHDLSLSAGIISGSIEYAQAGTEDLVDTSTGTHYDYSLPAGVLGSHVQESRIERVNTTGYLRTNGDAGGMVASASNTTFTDCTNSAALDTYFWVETPYNGSYVGGIVGEAESGTVLVRCFNEQAGPYGIETSCSLATGGIVGYAEGNVTIDACANVARVNTTCRCTGDCDHGHVGGIVGAYDNSNSPGALTLTRSYSYGDVSGDKDDRTAMVAASVSASGAHIERIAYLAGGTEAFGDFSGSGDACQAFDYDAFMCGTVAAYLGAPWGHSCGVDEMTGEFSCPDVTLGEQFPVLGGVPFYEYWDEAAGMNVLTFAGDLDGNGYWDTKDVNIASQLVSGKTMGLPTSQHEMLLRGLDFNGDGQCTIADVTALIARMLHITETQN